jgi:tetratricopeptide (TPR) repeat protein
MNDQYQYFGDNLTPSIAQELIRELFAGKTIERQEIIKTVDEEHLERGGAPAKSVYHPVERSLTSMKKSGRAENPEHGLWCILSEEPSQDEASQSEKSAQIETLDQFMVWARQFERGEYVFRGVPNEAYGIQASAYRRPEEKDRSFEKFLHINKDLIREARLRGYDQKDGRELKELEILADLQHFNAATCLIDFSHSAQVALFFACQPSPEKPRDCEKSQESKKPPKGKVFVERNQPPRFKEITPKLLREDIDYFLKDGEESQLYHWQPRQQNHRIIAQQSIFLFGSYEFDPDGECVIAGDSKENILKELQKVSGITEDRLFPDFEGFARLRGGNAPYTELTPSEYKNRGSLAYERGDYKDAITDYDIAIDKDPNYAEAYYLRGLTRRSLKQREESIVDFDDAIRLNPNRAEAYYERGLAKGSLERYEEAVVDSDEAIRLNPDYTKAYLLRGGVRFNLERYEEAIVDFTSVLRLDPKHTEAYYWRGRAKYSLKRYEEAIVDFDEAIHLSIENSRNYYWRGISKKQLGQNAASIVDFDRAIRLEPTYAYSHYHRGEAKFNLNRSAEAKADLGEALSLAKQSDDDAIIRWILNLLDKIE